MDYNIEPTIWPWRTISGPEQSRIDAGAMNPEGGARQGSWMILASMWLCVLRPSATRRRQHRALDNHTWYCAVQSRSQWYGRPSCLIMNICIRWLPMSCTQSPFLFVLCNSDRKVVYIACRLHIIPDYPHLLVQGTVRANVLYILQQSKTVVVLLGNSYS